MSNFNSEDPLLNLTKERQMNKHYLAVEKVVEHEDGSATYTFDMSNDTRDMFVSEGVRLILMCAVAKISVEDAFDMLHDIAESNLDE